MATKKINTDLQLTAKLLDTSGDAGTSNQVLVSTATGINWVDGSGSGIIGGPYLPLAGGTLSGDLTVSGDLIISGSETILNTETVQVEDNIIQLNRTPGSPDTATAATSGITIYRGNGVTEASLIFDDADDTWDLTNNLAVAGNLTIGESGTTPLLDMMFNDHANGPGWDTRIQMGLSNDFAAGTGAFPTYVPSGAYGVQFQAYSDGVFFGMEEYTAGHYRPIIQWGDDNSDSPFRIKHENGSELEISYDGNVTTTGNLIVGGTSGTINGNAIWHAGNDGSGSGLDADLLDGQHASAFLTSYTETDTLATVTGRGSSTTTSCTFNTITMNTPVVGSSNKIKFANNDYIRYDDANGVGRFHFDADGGTNNASVQAATFVGALSTTGISGNNYNITGVNQLEINDPGEGIIWKSGSSGDITLAVVDDSSDNILRLSGTGAELQVGTNRVLTVADEGSGNGLDADTLDGNHASAFALSSHNHDSDYVNVTGDTMTGNLFIGSGSSDNYVRSYYSDGAYTEMRGYGLYMSRIASYIRPTADNSQTLYIGTGVNQWMTVSIDSSTTAFKTNGSEHMRINSSGNVGINETNPIAALHINKSGVPQLLLDGGGDTTGDIVVPTGEILQIGHWLASTSTYTDRFRIIANGNVGIGETNPDTILHIKDSGTGLKIEDSSGTDTYAQIKFDGGDLDIYSRNGTSYGDIQWWRDNGTAAQQMMRLNGSTDRSLRLYAYGSGNITGTATKMLAVTSAGIVIEETLPPSQAVDGSGTANYVAKWSDADTIGNSIIYDNGSSVGIGETNPSDGDLNINNPKLHVLNTGSAGTYNLVARFQAGPDSDNTGAAIAINHSNDRGLLIKAGRKDSDRPAAYFDLIDSSGSTTNLLTMGEYGSNFNVGIGTTSPSAKLHVHSTSGDGLIRVTGDNIINSGGAIKGFNNGLAFNVAPSGGGSEIEAIRIEGDGNVGIGTPSPDALLRIDQNANATAFKVTGGGSGLAIAEFLRDVGATASVRIHASNAHPTVQMASANNTFSLGVNNTSFQICDNDNLTANARLVIDSNGNVGINETNPSYKLHVEGNSYINATSASANLTLGRHSGQPTIKAGSDDGGYLIMDSSGGRVGLNWYSGDHVVLAQGGGNVGINETNPSYKLDVNGGTDNTLARFSSTDDVAQIQISDNDTETWVGAKDGLSYISKTAGTPVDGIVIDNSNNVGIGTISPDDKLHIVGSNGSVRIDNSSSTKSFSLTVMDSNNRFRVYDNTASSERLTITNGGNVGINETNPSYKLDVNGNARLTGDLYVDGGQVYTNNSQARTKFCVWSDTVYGIGMQNSYTYGHLNNDFAMTFQMNNDDDRGFWWGDNTHTNSQGAMSLTTTGKATIATSLSVGEGQTVTSPSDKTLHVDGETETTNLSYPYPTATDQFHGEIVTFGTFVTGINNGDIQQGDIIVYTTAGTNTGWFRAQGNTTYGKKMLGIAMGSSPSDGILIKGFARDTHFSTTGDGDVLYLSASSAGDAADSPPDSTNNIVRIIGYMIDDSTDTIFFDPDKSWVQVSS